MKDYYIVHFIFQTASFYCIWYTEDTDGLITEEGKLKYCSQLSELYYYCNENKINLNEEITEYNLNNLFKWVLDNTTEIDCNYMLDTWNIISDIAHSLNERFYGDNNDVTDIYAKLFYGSNLPCINTGGEEYIPVWNAQELEKLNKVFRSGISILSEKCGFQLDS